MSAMRERLPILLEEFEEDVASLERNARDPVKDQKGSASGFLADSLRFRGVAAFALNGDITTFRSFLAQASTIHLELIRRYERGEPISPSYVSMMSYEHLLDALAAANFRLAVSLAEEMGGREAIEQEHDHPFDYAFGYALRAFVRSDPNEMQHRITQFNAESCLADNINFRGYVRVLKGILSKNEVEAQEGLIDVAKGHLRECKGDGAFRDMEDEVLCVWGVGMANLARMHGLRVQGAPPLIPESLLA